MKKWTYPHGYVHFFLCLSYVYPVFILCHMIPILIKALKFRHYSLEKCYTLHLKALKNVTNTLTKLTNNVTIKAQTNA